MRNAELNGRRGTSAVPTRARYVVIFFAMTLAMITYVDRVVFAQAKPEIAQEFQLSNSQMGVLMSVFGLAYMLFEVPGGWLADRFGPRSLLSYIVLWWSLFTAATGWAWSYASLLTARFLFGAGEAGCFPGIARMFANWLKGDERVKAQAFTWASARWGGAFAPLLVVWVIGLVGSWRWAFGVFGLLGVVWAAAFRFWFRNRPHEHPGVNDAERALVPETPPVGGHVGAPWGRWLRSRTVWLLCTQYALISVGFWFYTNWLPSYLREGRGLEFQREKAALLAGLPLFLGGASCLISGQVLTWLSRRWSDPRRARRVMALIGFLGAGLLMLLSIALRDPVAAMMAMGLACFCNDITMPGTWAACLDLGGRHAGTLAGAMNMAGSLGGMLSPLMVGLLLDLTHQNWTVPLYVIAGAYLAGGFCWLGIDPVTPLDAEGEPAAR
jgi:ACS family glucarate transporter-like MFS transporter